MTGFNHKGSRTILKLWNNLLKFSLMRIWNVFFESFFSVYRLFVRMLRKANRRIIRFSWLQALINRVLPCPQMVHCYIDPAVGIEEFFTILNRRGVRYTVLRWFEELPSLQKGEDIDMLVHDDDIGKIKDLLVVLPTGVPCDIYSVSPLSGTSYCKGIPLYPSHLAQEILETSIMYKDTYRVPDLKHHFLSLAYHAVYHKPEESGLAHSKDEVAAHSNEERSYGKTLVTLGKRLGLNILPDLQSLRELLTEHGWAPRMDVLRRIAGGSPSLIALAAESSTHRLLPKDTLRYAFDVHGVRVLIESNSASFIDYVRRDFCFFHKPQQNRDSAHVRITFLNMTPPWDEIPRSAVPLYKTAVSTVYKQGPNRYIDHQREVLAIYDLNRDEGTVYSSDSDAMYRIAYAMLMTRIGLRLDGIRLHRIHALAITVNEVALLFLGDGGLGKTTLGLELMKQSRVGWLTDDILPVDSDGIARALPTSPRLVEGSAVPWLPPSVELLKAPMPKEPPKVQLPSWSILSRVCASAKLGALFLCSRQSGVGPSIRKAGFFEAFRGICDNALIGKEFGHMIAYHLQFSWPYLYKMSSMYLSRVRTFIYLSWTVPVMRFQMSGNIPENASVILDMYPAMPEIERVSAADCSSVRAPALKERTLSLKR
jgi:hypothetical protein